MHKNFKKTAVMAIFAAILFGGYAQMSKATDSIKDKDGVFAVMETTRGDIVLELYYKQTPLTVTNFVGLAEGTLDAAKGKPFYDGLKFHRVISKKNGDEQDFMIQGGDPRMGKMQGEDQGICRAEGDGVCGDHASRRRGVSTQCSPL